MGKILLVYAPKGGNVEKVATKFAEIVGTDRIELLLINEVNELLLSKLNSADKYIMVISTVGRSNWDSFYTKIGWDLLLPELKGINFAGKKVGIIGLGDHLLFPDNFVDSMGLLYDSLIEAKAKIVGQVSAKEYDFSDSFGLKNGFFVGLPIDEDNEGELTIKRINKWIALIKEDFGL